MATTTRLDESIDSSPPGRGQTRTWRLHLDRLSGGIGLDQALSHEPAPTEDEVGGDPVTARHEVGTGAGLPRLRDDADLLRGRPLAAGTSVLGIEPHVAWPPRG